MPPSFSGHETFPLRFTWLAKAVEAASESPGIFGDDTAIATFGVGRNMVRAIKHWGLATDVLEPLDRGRVAPTAVGRRVFGPDGTDPYCEDPGTLWLLHWHLARDAGRAALWHLVFGHGRAGAGLDLRTLQPMLAAWLDRLGEPDAMPSTGTLRRDLQCLAAMYAPPSPRADPEDAVSCPLTTLGLVQNDGGTLYLRPGHPATLPPAVFAYAVLDHWQRRHPGVETLGLDRVLHEDGAPGRVFLLSEDGAFDLLARAEALEHAPFRYDSTAGLRQLYRTPGASPEAMLDAHYALAAV